MSNAVLKTFETYQKSRVQFVQTVAEYSKRKENFESLQSAGVLLLLRPLLLDVVPSVAQTACIAIGRMASESSDIAEAVISLDILPQIIYSIGDQNRFFKKCAAFVLRAVAKHSPDNATSIVDSDGLSALSKILSEFDPSVKEAACWAISYIAKHNAQLANTVLENIPLEKLTQCVQEPELGLKRIATFCLTQIAKHNAELAKKVVFHDEAIKHLADLLKQSKDFLLKRQIISCFSCIVIHNQELAERILEKRVLDKIISLLKDSDQIVRINTAECIKNIVKHSKDCSKIICDLKGHIYLLNYLEDNDDNYKEPALLALYYISDYDDNLAKDIMKESNNGINIIKKCLTESKIINLKRISAGVLGNLGRHSEDHSLNITNHGVIEDLIIICEDNNIRNDDLKKDVNKAIRQIIQNSKNLEIIKKIITNTNTSNLIVMACRQIQKIIENPTQKKEFFAKKWLNDIVLLKHNNKFGDDTNIQKAITDICNMYPQDVINYLTPNYADKLVKKLDNYQLND